MHPMLIVAVRAARRAGRLITRASEDLDRIKVARKQANDFVTEVDRGAEQEVVETLLAAYPDHSILAEEFGITSGPQAQQIGLAGTAEGISPSGPSKAQIELLNKLDHVWIIDPLDGTTNFIHNMPHYAVSIALMERGVITQGVVYDPNRDELFTASKGRGAFLNDRRIRVSRRDRIEESLIGTGFPYRQLDQLDRYMGIFRTLTERKVTLRRPGAAALDLAYVGCGRYDAFFEIGLAPWDVAAGSLIVTEAGGLIGDFNADGNPLFAAEVLAAAPKVFTAMLPVVGGRRG